MLTQNQMHGMHLVLLVACLSSAQKPVNDTERRFESGQYQHTSGPCGPCGPCLSGCTSCTAVYWVGHVLEGMRSSELNSQQGVSESCLTGSQPCNQEALQLKLDISTLVETLLRDLISKLLHVEQRLILTCQQTCARPAALPVQ